MRAFGWSVIQGHWVVGPIRYCHDKLLFSGEAALALPLGELSCPLGVTERVFFVFPLSGPLWRATSPIGGGKLALL